MNRLQSEVHRLYVPQAPGGRDTEAEEPRLVDADGRVRAMVLELARPADWAALSAVWQGVQVDLALPAPAIAVSGRDGYQLWFSLLQPVPAAQAMVFLEALRARYLGEVKPQRVVLMPALDAASPPHLVHARTVPAQQVASGHWSAFVAQDLAPVFADEPWLDMPPSPVGQSDLLSRLGSIPPADFQQALEQLRPAALPAQALPTPALAEPVGAGAGSVTGPTDHRPSSAGVALTPQRFLLDVMHDDSAALALRIEAAKALLPYFDEPRRP